MVLGVHPLRVECGQDAGRKLSLPRNALLEVRGKTAEVVVVLLLAARRAGIEGGGELLCGGEGVEGGNGGSRVDDVIRFGRFCSVLPARCYDVVRN